MTTIFPAHEWQCLCSERRRSLAEPEEYIQAFEWRQGQRVIDLGCGPGFFVPALVEAVGPTGRCVAFDLQPEMLTVLGEEHPDIRGLDRVAGSLGALPFGDASFDVGWCACVAHELADLSAMLAEARRILAPGGALIIVDWVARQTDHGPPRSERISASRLAHSMRVAGFRVGRARAVTSQHYGLVGSPVT